MKQRKNIKQEVNFQGSFTQKQQNKIQILLMRIQTMRIRMYELGYGKKDVQNALFKALQGQCQKQQKVTKNNIQTVLKRIFINCKDMNQFVDSLVMRFQTHMSEINQNLPPESDSQQQQKQTTQQKSKQEPKLQLPQVKKQISIEKILLDDSQEQFFSMNPKKMKRSELIRMLVEHRERRKIEKSLEAKHFFTRPGRIMFDFDLES